MEVDPRSMPLVAIHMRWEEIRLSSTRSMRIQSDRGGISTPEQGLDGQGQTSSLCSGAR